MGKTYKDERQFDRKQDVREQREFKRQQQWGEDEQSTASPQIPKRSPVRVTSDRRTARS